MENKSNWTVVRNTTTGELFRLRIRKLTPTECLRLMGVSDTNSQKILSAVSNSQAYKQAGNSIVVDQMVYLFESLFYPEEAMKRNLVSLSRMAKEYPTDLISRAYQSLKNIFGAGKKSAKTVIKDISTLNNYEVEMETIEKPSLFDINDFINGEY